MNNGKPLKIYYKSISREDEKGEPRERKMTKVSLCMENLQVFPHFYGCQNVKNTHEHTHTGI